MNRQSRHQPPSRTRPGRERISRLLARYPDVSAEEARTILNFLRAGRYFDVGLLTSNARLQPNLDAFVKDHRRHFAVEPDRAHVIVGAIFFLLALSAFWIAIA